MRTYALATRGFRLATWIATGTPPHVAPPLSVDTFRPSDMDGADLVVVCVHGLAGQPYWYDDQLHTIASAAQVRLAKLDGAIVYLAGCFGEGPMSDALLAAGAACVVADEDLNWSGKFWPRGSLELGRLFIGELKRGRTVGPALETARQRYSARHQGSRDLELVDTIRLLGDGQARLTPSGGTLRGVK